MTKKALVIETDGTTATVRCTVDLCASCTGELCGVRSQDLRVVVPAGTQLQEDDWVEISYSSRDAALDALLLLGLPIGAFALSYGIAPSVLGAVTEGVRIAFGVAGLAMGALVPILRKLYVPESGLPVVNRVIRRRPSLTDSSDEQGQRTPVLTEPGRRAPR